MADSLKNLARMRLYALSRVFQAPGTPGTPLEHPDGHRPWVRWPPECLASEERFGQPHARLFPLIGREVSTPDGRGTLVQVFAARSAVVIAGRVIFVFTAEVCP